MTMIWYASFGTVLLLVLLHVHLFATFLLPFLFPILRVRSCLDRTNVAQFSAGVEALGQQLVVMGIRNTAKLDPSVTSCVC